MQDLGRLKRVTLRSIWNNEAIDFTPWLSRENNLNLLADTIGLDLDLEATEHKVGPFRADIVCKDTITDSYVLIENQLERTNHSHLGQLLTYAAGLDAVTIVWIAEHFTEEHRAALDWLNEVTEEDINFFGLEIELWRIGDSDIAPKFNVVSKPNNWTKQVMSARQIASEGDLTDTKQLQLEYWTAFKNTLEERGSKLKSRQPRPRHWSNYAIGRSNFRLSATVNTRENFVAAALVIDGPEAKLFFHLLEEEREAIEREFGGPLDWRELPEAQRSYIYVPHMRVDPLDKSTWPEQHRWLADVLERLYSVFHHRVKRLDITSYSTDNVDPINGPSH